MVGYISAKKTGLENMLVALIATIVHAIVSTFIGGVFMKSINTKKIDRAIGVGFLTLGLVIATTLITCSALNIVGL